MSRTDFQVQTSTTTAAETITAETAAAAARAVMSAQLFFVQTAVMNAAAAT